MRLLCDVVLLVWCLYCGCVCVCVCIIIEYILYRVATTGMCVCVYCVCLCTYVCVSVCVCGQLVYNTETNRVCVW